jgi:hypothetical protein
LPVSGYKREPGGDSVWAPAEQPRSPAGDAPAGEASPAHGKTSPAHAATTVILSQRPAMR